MSKKNSNAALKAETPVIDEAFIGKLENTSQGEMLYDFANKQVQLFVDALNEGKLPCQPKAGTVDNSYCDTYAARNVVWDNTYHGINQMTTKIHQREFGYKTGDYLTVESAEKAYEFYGRANGISMDGVELLKKDAVPIVIMIADKGMPKFQNLYNIDSFGDPSAIRKYAAHLQHEKQEYIKEQKEKKGEKYYEPKPKSHDNGVVVCKNASDPVAVIGQWEAACSTGKGFKITFEQNESFINECNAYITKPMENGKNNSSYRLAKLMEESGKYCREFIPNLFKKKEAPEHTMAMAEPEMGR